VIVFFVFAYLYYKKKYQQLPKEEVVEPVVEPINRSDEENPDDVENNMQSQESHSPVLLHAKPLGKQEIEHSNRKLIDGERDEDGNDTDRGNNNEIIEPSGNDIIDHNDILLQP